MARPICPHCGYDLAKDQPILLNDFSMHSSISPLCWRGTAIRLTGAESAVVWALMKAWPSPMRISVLLERADSEADEQTVRVLVCRVRKKLRAVGAPDPIGSYRVPGGAYIWKVDT